MDITSPSSGSTREGIERVAALLLLLMSLPLLAVIALLIALETGMPVLFRQVRVGLAGRHFFILKLRSMCVGIHGPSITQEHDFRITRMGAFVRKYKIDELPQLWNIIRGDMQFIGPRPEVPLYVDLCNPLWIATLQFKPGLTDISSLVYRQEQMLLASSDSPEHLYRNHILPHKLSMSTKYQQRRDLVRDLEIVALSITAAFRLDRFTSSRIRRLSTIL
jgi:lipopolysaccharide/colanic/teichoic acid biosynthesis glycosyltransferase